MRENVVVFPLSRHVGKIRDVASKLHAKKTVRHADYYRSQVTDGLVARFTRIGIPEERQCELLRSFWAAVDWELARLLYREEKGGPHDVA